MVAQWWPGAVWYTNFVHKRDQHHPRSHFSELGRGFNSFFGNSKRIPSRGNYTRDFSFCSLPPCSFGTLYIAYTQVYLNYPSDDCSKLVDRTLGSKSAQLVFVLRIRTKAGRVAPRSPDKSPSLFPALNDPPFKYASPNRDWCAVTILRLTFSPEHLLQLEVSRYWTLLMISASLDRSDPTWKKQQPCLYRLYR